MIKKTDIRFMSFPLTEPPPAFIGQVYQTFVKHEKEINTKKLEKGLKSDEVMKVLSSDLESIGWKIEVDKTKESRIERPVFFGENGEPTLKYHIDGYHEDWKCGIEIEAGRGWLGNAIYRDLIQALVMVQVDHLIIAVSNEYKYKSINKDCISNDYDNSISVAKALYGHSRIKLPYGLTIIGY